MIPLALPGVGKRCVSDENDPMAKGVACDFCGATTPLPDNLLAPTFTCRYCHATLPTARYAGRAAVSADAIGEHMQEILENPPPGGFDSVPMPRFEQSVGSRTDTCKVCGHAVEVPLDLAVSAFACKSCGRTQSVRDYISNEDRLMLEMQRQDVGSRQLEVARQQGVRCGRCGAPNEVPDDGSIQIVCRFCGAAILLAEHVDADALARSRLWHNVVETAEEQASKQEERQRQRDQKVTIYILVAIVLAIVLMALFLGVVFWSAGFFE